MTREYPTQTCCVTVAATATSKSIWKDKKQQTRTTSSIMKCAARTVTRQCCYQTDLDWWWCSAVENYRGSVSRPITPSRQSTGYLVLQHRTAAVTFCTVARVRRGESSIHRGTHPTIQVIPIVHTSSMLHQMNKWQSFLTISKCALIAQTLHLDLTGKFYLVLYIFYALQHSLGTWTESRLLNDNYLPLNNHVAI
jgi:hypothetical protein